MFALADDPEFPVKVQLALRPRNYQVAEVIEGKSLTFGPLRHQMLILSRHTQPLRRKRLLMKVLVVSPAPCTSLVFLARISPTVLSVWILSLFSLRGYRGG